MGHRRSGKLLVVGILAVLTACSSTLSAPTSSPESPTSATRSDDPPTKPASPPEPVPQVKPDPPENTRSALDDRFDRRLPEPLLDPFDVAQGGPPPDGIPPIDEPTFQPADEVDWLGAGEPVLSLTVGEETRAYPLQVMTWHEIVNDTVDGVPVAVTYCPLCNSGVAFEREVGNRILSFGTSGMLYADNLVMYDRQTESLWPQLTGQAAFGVLTRTQLRAIPMGTVAWEDFRAANPRALVLSRETGFSRPYGQNPYVGYDNPNGGLLFDLPDDVDARLRVKERVIGISNGNQHLAVVRASVAAASPAEVTVGGRTLAVWFKAGQRSALDRETVAVGRDVGTVGVYVPLVDGRRLHFEADGDGFRDRETDSRWSILGRAVGGPLEGTQLEPYRHLDTFWFAWVAFQPETEVLVLQQ